MCPATYAGNQSPIPFDTLWSATVSYTRRLGINHQSPLIHFAELVTVAADAGNQSPIPFDTLDERKAPHKPGWESITNPL